MHRVIAAIAPLSPRIDLTHGVRRHDVRAGAWALWRAAPYLAPAVVVAVVDPGVGGPRRAVAVEVGAGEPLYLVGPDNGLLLPAAHRCGPIRRAVALDDPRWHLPARPGIGVTFAGRDVFAPAGAHLAAGVDLHSLGAPVDPAGLVGTAAAMALPGPGGRVQATVTWVDAFGNVQLDVTAAALPGPGAEVELRLPATAATAQLRAVVAGTYGELGGHPGLVPDSSGLVALCLDRGDAARTFGLDEGDEVVVDPASGGTPGTLGG